MARRKFHLRGCRALTPTEADYKHCLYANLKYCTAPCIGNVSQEEYLGQVKAAVEFLRGQTGELEAQLEREMRSAAQALDFEKAAKLRDALRDIRKTTLRTEKFERTPYTLPLALDPAGDLMELARVLDLPKPPARIEGFDISNISGTFAVASMVSFKSGKPDRSNYRRFKMKTVSGQNDFACMAETVRRRYSRLLRESQGRDADSESSPSMPDLILIDGGKGQLGVATEELAKLGLSWIPVIGLAKEFEEIHRPGGGDPLRLPHSNPALKLLQRVRDESHRFANTYNAQLRLKKMSESLLDEFSGMGANRKAAILKHFGSMEKLRMATAEEIAAVPGFGDKLAAELRAFLDARRGR